VLHMMLPLLIDLLQPRRAIRTLVRGWVGLLGKVCGLEGFLFTRPQLLIPPFLVPRLIALVLLGWISLFLAAFGVIYLPLQVGRYIFIDLLGIGPSPLAVHPPLALPPILEALPALLHPWVGFVWHLVSPGRRSGVGSDVYHLLFGAYAIAATARALTAVWSVSADLIKLAKGTLPNPPAQDAARPLPTVGWAIFHSALVGLLVGFAIPYSLGLWIDLTFLIPHRTLLSLPMGSSHFQVPWIPFPIALSDCV